MVTVAGSGYPQTGNVQLATSDVSCIHEVETTVHVALPDDTAQMLAMPAHDDKSRTMDAIITWSIRFALLVSTLVLQISATTC